MPGSRFRAGLEADLPELCDQPIRAAHHIGGMDGLSGNTRYADKIKQFGNTGINHKKTIYCGLFTDTAQDVVFFPCEAMSQF
jgi:hypothetical protein